MCAAYTLETSPDRLLLRLRGEITIEHAAALQKDLLASAYSAKAIHVDTTELVRLDAAILQILLLLNASASAPLVIVRSPAWDACLERFGSDLCGQQL